MELLYIVIFLAFLTIIFLALYVFTLKKVTHINDECKAISSLNQAVYLNYGDVRLSNAFADSMTKICFGIMDETGAEIYLNSLSHTQQVVEDAAKTEKQLSNEWDRTAQEKELAAIRIDFYYKALMVAAVKCQKSKEAEHLIAKLKKIGGHHPGYLDRSIVIRLEMDQDFCNYFENKWNNALNKRLKLSD